MQGEYYPPVPFNRCFNLLGGGGVCEADGGGIIRQPGGQPPLCKGRCHFGIAKMTEGL